MDYETIFASLPDAVCVVDRSGQVVTASPALESLLGWHLSGLSTPLTDSLAHLIPDPAQTLQWTIALGQALDYGQTTDLFLPTAISTGSEWGTVTSVTGSVAPWRDTAGQIVGALLTLRPTAGSTPNDIRERFAAMVAHELSSPVANISAAAERLSEPNALDAPQRLRLLQILRTETQRLRRLLGQFLTEPGPQGNTSLPNTIVTLRPLFRRVAHTFELQDRHLQIVVHIPADIPFVWGDAGRIEEVLSNLVDHALRLAPPGSSVSVTAAELGQTVVLTISAPAAGMRPEIEPTALTLQLAEAAVQALGGELSHNYDPATGTQFCFALQAVDGARDAEE